MNTEFLPAGVQITPLPAFTDNYIWCFHNQMHCVVVDPGDAKVVESFCQQHGLTLAAILITHHHADHTGGLPQLTKTFSGIDVFGPCNPSIKLINQRLTEGQQIHIDTMDLTFDVIELPGHTLDHIAYIGHGGALCGDTLFSAGCGRLFEGSPRQMLHSLAKLRALPDSTQVWCTHEYTLANLAFASAVEPNNQAIVDYSQWAMQMREQDVPTLPTDIKTQKAINPFLRADYPAVRQSAEAFAEKELSSEEAVFAAVRRWKDNF